MEGSPGFLPWSILIDGQLHLQTCLEADVLSTWRSKKPLKSMVFPGDDLAMDIVFATQT